MEEKTHIASEIKKFVSSNSSRFVGWRKWRLRYEAVGKVQQNFRAPAKIQISAPQYSATAYHSYRLSEQTNTEPLSDFLKR